MKIAILTAFAAIALSPAAILAQGRVTCGDYLAMTPEAKIAAVETVKVSLVEAGQGFRFDAAAQDADKLKYVDSACTNADAWPGLALFDILGQ